MLADPIRSSDYSKYRGVHCMTPNRLEAQLATGMTIARPEDALAVGRRLVEDLGMESVLVTLDRDGMALVRADGRAEIVPTRPRAGVRHHRRGGHGPLRGRPLPGRRRRLRRGGRARQRRRGPGGREDRGRAPRAQEILRDLIDHQRPEAGKRLDREGLIAEVRRRRLAGQTVVFTNGCFDLLHVGHVRLLREAAGLGDFLVVGLNADASVRRLKGPSRPINPEDIRGELLAALECIDAVTIFDEDTPLALIEAILPDVLVKGGDYLPDEVVGRDVVEAAGGRLVLVPLVPGHSTTQLALSLRNGDRTVAVHPAEPSPPAPASRSRRQVRIPRVRINSASILSTHEGSGELPGALACRFPSSHVY